MRAILSLMAWFGICWSSLGFAGETVSYAFEGDAALEGLELAATGEAAKRMPKPKLHNGQLYLLESWWKSTATVGFPTTQAGLTDTVSITFDLTMNTGTEGFGLLWLSTEQHGVEGIPEVQNWEAPDLAGCFGIGFDASNPPNRDPFRGSGNTYDRPQHEVSLHWDAMERVKRTTPMDFRDEKPHRVEVQLRFQVGGATVDVQVDGQVLFDGYFVPGLMPYAGRAVMGARNSENAGDVMVDSVEISCGDSIEVPRAPVQVVALDRVLNDKNQTKNEATVDFPDDTDAYGRIICTLRLDQPETRFDPWDRLANLYTYDDDGERIEILRYITPYDKGHEWQVDVTRFRPLLRGKRKIEQACTTYGEGWLVTVRFDFYPGECDLKAYRVVKLWSGSPVVGNPEKPTSEFFTPRTVELDDDTDSVEVYTVVTGHGMFPNTNNAAEFMPLGRTLTVNGANHYNVLWKADCYLNPCRPQGGTWKYDRAGWAPGDVVAPWSICVAAPQSKRLEIAYRLDEYLNEARGKTWEPFHRTEAYAILYR